MNHNDSNHKITRDLLLRQMAAQHLGPQGTTNVLQQQFITQVMEGKSTSSAPPPADPVITGGGRKPPQPPPGGTPIVATTVGAHKKPETYRIASRSRSVNTRPKPPQPPPPPDAPGVEAMTTETQQKRGRAIIGEEAIKARRRITTKSKPPSSLSVPRAKPPPKIMETETQQKRFAKDEATGSGPPKKISKAHEEVLALPKTESKKAAPPTDTRPKNPQPNRKQKPPKKITPAEEEAVIVSPPKPPDPPPPPIKKKRGVKKDKVVDPATATVNMVIKELIKAKTSDLLTADQIKQFEELVRKLKTKDGPAEVKAQMQTELRTMYRTKVYGK